MLVGTIVVLIVGIALLEDLKYIIYHIKESKLLYSQQYIILTSSN